MPTRTLVNVPNLHGTRSHSYEPAYKGDFRSFNMRIPESLGNSTQKAEYLERLTLRVRLACGNTACEAIVWLESNGDATLYCSGGNFCPIDNPLEAAF